MKLNLRTPKLAIVTGAGSGIGRATAISLAVVIVSDIDLDAARSTTALIRGHAGRAHACLLDVTDPDAWQSFADTVRQEHGVADVLVNNAGMLVGGRFLDYTPADWDKQLGVNLLGVVHGCRVIGRQMVDAGQGGHIVNIASAAAFTPLSVASAYSVSKAGVKMLSECLRLEFAPYGIGVTAVCPGVINTNIADNSVIVGLDPETIERGKRAQRRVQQVAALLPIEVMSPNLVARAVRRGIRYVLGRVAPGINRRAGQVLSVDRMRAGGEYLARRLDPAREANRPRTTPVNPSMKSVERTNA
jgi:NAD(P)-dependent dehydrogenase (short-subunit alcohol dehydrogenase family)